MNISVPQELQTLRECGRLLAEILGKITSQVKLGVSTFELDCIAEKLIREAGGDPAFKGYRSHISEKPYPASICTSINDEVVHAIPRKDRVLKIGDILGIDIGMRWPAPRSGARLAHKGGPLQGLITDMAVTVPVGRIAPSAEELLQVTKEALERGIRAIRPNIRMGDLGYIIQKHIEENGFGVVRDLVGHGVGKHLHENPYVPNFGKEGDGIKLKEGMVIAIEPMATMGSPLVRLADDGWTWKTRDGSLAAHFEHTIVIMKEGAEVLTRAR